jgi:anti-sigma B factor antagonist
VAPGLEASWKDLEDGTAVVSLAGELDLAGSESLGPPIADSLRERALIVDLRQLSFIDTGGLRVLVGAQRSARDNERGFAVVDGSSRAVTSVLELTKASSQIPIFPSIEAAQASF